MRSDWVFEEELQHVLAALMPSNRLACEISMATGLRISDVLALTREQAVKGRFSLHEKKTGKVRRIRLPLDLQRRALLMSGNIYVFEHRFSGKKHRTRQAVYKDLRRAARLFRVKPHVSPHSLRKVWAVEQYHKDGDLKRVQALLNHDSEAVTVLYAMADQITARRMGFNLNDGKFVEN